MSGEVAKDGVSARATEARRSSVALISAAICLRGGKPYVPCTTCAVNCPVDAINFGGRAATVSESCLGCGVCSVTCPSGAIDVADFDVPPNVGGHISIECSRVPVQKLQSETWVVPCIAGLGISDVVAAANKRGGDAAEVSIAFIDRGLCNSCPIAGGNNQIASVFARFLDVLGRTKSTAIRLERVGLPIHPTEALPPGLRAPSSRRAFLRSFIAPLPRGKRSAGIQHERVTLAQLAASATHALDASFFPAITVSQGCQDHGVCAASCPTGALRRETSGVSDEIHRLVFDPTQCIACGRCAEVCPERALSFAASGAAQMQSEPVILRETRLSVCPRCEDAYVDDGAANEFCPVCCKDHSLFVDLFSAPRPAAVAKPEIADRTV